MRFVVALALSFGSFPVFAQPAPSGNFDYYVLALSWSPNWCVRQGNAQRAEQCAADLGYGFTLHGLWPQYELGWPSFCRTSHSDPSRAQTGAMADIMGSSGLAWYQWQKHGKCSGLSAQQFYAASRQAYDLVVFPDLFLDFQKTVNINPAAVERAFIEKNPALSPEMITITCADGMIQEARICLTKNLEPRACSEDVQRDCRLPNALLHPVR